VILPVCAEAEHNKAGAKQRNRASAQRQAPRSSSAGGERNKVSYREIALSSP